VKPLLALTGGRLPRLHRIEFCPSNPRSFSTAFGPLFNSTMPISGSTVSDYKKRATKSCLPRACYSTRYL
jgi:hypothetical protein